MFVCLFLQLDDQLEVIPLQVFGSDGKSCKVDVKLMNGRVGPREEMIVPVDVTWTAEVTMLLNQVNNKVAFYLVYPMYLTSIWLGWTTICAKSVADLGEGQNRPPPPQLWNLLQ